MPDYYAWLGPLLRRFSPETAHHLALLALRLGWVPSDNEPDDPILQIKLFGQTFNNPLGMAAGFDKNAEVVRGLYQLGFGFVEAGTVTPKPQAGNPQPRMFRLKEDEAVINRLGFNNHGADIVAARLQKLRKRPLPGILGINIGKNKTSEDALHDYVTCAQQLSAFTDYVVINVSSPNTPGLRALQNVATLKELIEQTRAVCAAPLLVKIAPDLVDNDLQDIATLALQLKLAGLVVTNTTITRPSSLQGKAKNELGGLSGAPLFALSTRILQDMYRLTQGQVPLIGVGGITSGADAYAKIRAGASLVQLYTAMIYQGPYLVAAIKKDLATRLRSDGFTSLQAAVGSA
jgi:dihydroorotate dehydrogenase